MTSPLRVAHRDAQDGAGAVAGGDVEAAVEARVLVGVGDVDDLRRSAATAPAMPLPSGTRISLGGALGDLAPQLVRSRSRMKSEQRSASTTFAAS